MAVKQTLNDNEANMRNKFGLWYRKCSFKTHIRRKI